MVDFTLHFLFGFLIRMLMIIFGCIQDELLEVKYTDIDYKVFTDAASYIVKGESPFKRHTYRYSPLLAYALVPNIVFHPAWGKFLFSCVDIIICIFIKKLLKLDNVNDKTVLLCMCFWLYNPLTIIISTRGNADSLAVFLVLGTLLAMKTKNYILAGIVHGLSVHFRIYPIAFSLGMYLSISSHNKKFQNHSNILKKMAVECLPSKERFKLVLSCLFTLLFVTMIFIWIYGYTFLYESFLYHLKRKDIRHNFSVYFYLQYLDSAIGDSALIQKCVIVLPKLVLLAVISVVYRSLNDIYFCQLLISYVMVTYNTVVTSQYFIWFLSFIPLVIPSLKFSLKESVFLITLWISAQLSWLLPAYLLEFKNQNTFIFIWIQGLVFFLVNIYVITRLVKNYCKKAVKCN